VKFTGPGICFSQSHRLDAKFFRVRSSGITYSASNAYLDGLSLWRRQEKLPCSSLQRLGGSPGGSGGMIHHEFMMINQVGVWKWGEFLLSKWQFYVGKVMKIWGVPNFRHTYDLCEDILQQVDRFNKSKRRLRSSNFGIPPTWVECCCAKTASASVAHYPSWAAKLHSL